MKRFSQPLFGLIQLALAMIFITAAWPEWMAASASLRSLAWWLAAPASVVCGLNGIRLLRRPPRTSRTASVVAIVSNLLTGFAGVAVLALTVAGLVLFRGEPGVFVRLFIHPLRIHGTVIDAQSGLNVSNVTITPGAPFGDGYSWSTSGSELITVAHYEKIFRLPSTQISRWDRTASPILLKFSAPGYQSVVTPSFRPRGGTITFDVRLQRAERAEGVVTKPDGTPADHATVLVISNMTSSSLRLRNGHIDGWQGDRAETDGTGRFEIDRPVGEFNLIVANAAGFASMAGTTTASTHEIRMQAWAQIEGHWLEAGRPSNAGRLNYNARGGSPFYISMTPEFEPATGRFTVRKVPPGPFTIYWQAPRAPDVPEQSLVLATGDARPGETLTMECSTTFRPVKGQIVREGSAPGLKFSQCFVILNPVHDQQPPIPENLTTTQERNAWWARWEQTEEGKAYAAIARNLRQIQVQSDGSFGCRFVTPGKYYLYGSWQDGSKDLGDIEAGQIEIPAGADAFDVGRLTVQAVQSVYLAKGDAAPAFSVPGVTGGTVSLAKRPGKIVLLDFWATNCAPCLAEIPNIWKVYDRYKSDARVQIISLDLDQSVERARKFIAGNRMEWQQGYLADGWKSSVTKAYGVNAIPALFLVGADGRILARNLRGSDIESEVASALRDQE